MPIIPDLDFSIGIVRIRAGLAKQQAEVEATLPEVPDVKTRDIWVPGFNDEDDEILMRVYEPDGHSAPSAGLYWIHGGGMVVGAYDGNDFQCKTWASQFKVPIVSVEYRLAPEHPYPAPLHDCYAGLRWMYRHAESLGVDRQRITVSGASAGGGLAAGTVLYARDEGEVAVRAQVLIYPMIDDRDVTPSNHEITYPKCWNHDANQWGWSAYLGDLYGTDDVPLYAAPARATVDDLRGLPPTFIDVGELDAFRDEDIEYAQKLMQAGVATDLVVTSGAFHASESYNPKAPSSRRILAARLDALGRALT
ncbi:MAG: alpha/beta hydrolase [Actinobacteria bacterium]|nr:alpha/beta hydrolase [Actinomycetota bacterium]